MLETEIEGVGTNGPSDVEGVLGHTFGATYAISRDWHIGAESVIESIYDNWNHYEGTTVYAGPVFSYQGGTIGRSQTSWWITATPMFQLTDRDEEADFQFRVIMGLNF